MRHPRKPARLRQLPNASLAQVYAEHAGTRPHVIPWTLPPYDTMTPSPLDHLPRIAVLEALGQPEALGGFDASCEIASTLAREPDGRRELAEIAALGLSREDVSADRLRAALHGLGCAPELSERHAALLCDAVGDERPLVIAEALTALTRRGADAHAERALSLLRHPSAEVRGAALRYAARTRPTLAHGLLVAALEDPDPFVRFTAVEELYDARGRSAARYLSRLRNDPDDRVRELVGTIFDEASSA